MRTKSNQRRAIRMNLAEELMFWLNTLDTEGMTAAEIRSKIHSHLMGIR